MMRTALILAALLGLTSCGHVDRTSPCVCLWEPISGEELILEVPELSEIETV